MPNGAKKRGGCKVFCEICEEYPGGLLEISQQANVSDRIHSSGERAKYSVSRARNASLFGDFTLGFVLNCSYKVL
jgi:hypothetical protein